MNGPHAARTIRPTRLIRAICLVGMCFYVQAAGQPGLFWLSQRLVHAAGIPALFVVKPSHMLNILGWLGWLAP